MNQKRLVFIFRDMGTGGAQKIEAFVANTMHESGYEVIAVNMAPTPCTVSIHPDIRIVNVEYDLQSHRGRIASILYRFQYLLRLRRTLVALKPDLVCAFLSDIVRITTLALRGIKIPIIGSERGDPYAFTKKQLDRYKKEYRRCTGVVFQLENVAKEYALPSSVFQKVIPNPSVPRKVAYSQRTTNPDRVIISAGRLSEQKRFDLLIDAFTIVHRQYPDYILRIYGDGPLRQELETQAAASTARDAICFMGDVEDVFNAAKDAEFFVLSSDFEGIPNVLIEAMASGIACVATDCSPGGARYLLADGERGLIAPRGDSAQLANAMMQYISDPALRTLHEKRGLAAAQEYAPENIQKMWLNIFEACL